MADKGGGDVFLLLPRILLEKGVFVDGSRMEGLGLPAVGHLLERVRVEGAGELLRTMLPMGGRPPLYGTMLEQVSEESLSLLVDLGLADRDIEPFFAGTRRFTTFIFFS